MDCGHIYVPKRRFWGSALFNQKWKCLLLFVRNNWYFQKWAWNLKFSSFPLFLGARARPIVQRKSVELNRHQTDMVDCLLVRDGFTKKTCCSFGLPHPPPLPHPNLDNLYHFFNAKNIDLRRRELFLTRSYCYMLSLVYIRRAKNGTHLSEKFTNIDLKCYQWW